MVKRGDEFLKFKGDLEISTFYSVVKIQDSSLSNWQYNSVSLLSKDSDLFHVCYRQILTFVLDLYRKTDSHDQHLWKVMEKSVNFQFKPWRIQRKSGKAANFTQSWKFRKVHSPITNLVVILRLLKGSDPDHFLVCSWILGFRSKPVSWNGFSRSTSLKSQKKLVNFQFKNLEKPEKFD